MKIQHFLLWLYTGSVFIACWGEEPEGPSYPPLKKEQLVGCWYKMSLPGVCWEECYDSGKYYFGKSNSKKLGLGETEKLGTYQISGTNLVSVDAISKSNSTAVDWTYSNRYNLFPKGDSLFSIESNTVAYIRSDSAHNCGSHWELFTKPADWKGAF